MLCEGNSIKKNNHKNERVYIKSPRSFLTFYKETKTQGAKYITHGPNVC